MKERPILFGAQMVRAILDGRKTQTRRVVKPEWWRCFDPEDADDRAKAVGMCPYGVPGDRLYVKEVCWIWGRWTLNGLTTNGRQRWRFRADPDHRARFDRPERVARRESPRPGFDGLPGWVYRHARFMPRWASRITLEIESVRVERVKDISESDAIAEGVEVVPGEAAYRDYALGPNTWCNDARGSFQTLWDAINAARGFGWDANPWVWVLEFRRVTA